MSIKYVNIEPVNETDKLLYKYCTSSRKPGYIEIGEEKLVLPEYYSTFADDIENFEVKDSDIWITSHPKTGVTWSQEMIWMIVNNLDFEEAQKPLIERSPFLEFKCLFDIRNTTIAEAAKNISKAVLHSVDEVRNQKSPRIIKTHLSFSLLPKQIRDKTKKPKIIHIIRNAKDTCVSYYHYVKLIDGFKGSFEEFCQMFKEGRLMFGPFWGNIMSYWSRREEYNILVIKYEDMKKDLASVILEVAKYLGKTLTEEQIRLLEDHLSFAKMKDNKSVNLEDYMTVVRKLQNSEGQFMRSGTVGSYKVDMTDDMVKKFDEWTAENIAGTGLSFDEV